MLQPKKQKYRKAFRGRRRGLAARATTLSFGDFGLKAAASAWLTARQIEAARKTITHHTKRLGKLWLRPFPDKPVTKKGAGVRMGSGKGDIDHYVAVIKPGHLIFELSGVTQTIAREAFRKASHKLPMKTVIVTKT
ncbi:50S ribosomal protein L16 [Microgenomates group bacterium RBG_16_45_19]|nr:ribosomal protein L16 [uncultured bacterium]OGV95974.1 MAG: 50S ribosomal protein L16 [Microgenomates group bacterium RBG_16_45_19]